MASPLAGHMPTWNPLEPTGWPCDHGVVRLADAHRCIQLLQYFCRQSLLGAATSTEQLWRFQWPHHWTIFFGEKVLEVKLR